MDKKAITHEELVELQVKFLHDMEAAYMQAECIDRKELLYRKQMGVYTASKVAQVVPPHLHPDMKPHRNQYIIRNA